MPDELAEEKPAGTERQPPEPEAPPRRPRRKRSLKIDNDAVVRSVLDRVDHAISDRSEWMNMRLDRYAKESPTIGERHWRQLERQFHLSRVPPDPVWTPDTITIPESEMPDPTSNDMAGGQDGR